MKKSFSILLLSSMLLSSSAFLASCSKDDKDNTEFEDSDIPFEEGSSERQYLEETAVNLLDLFKPQDQSQLISALNHFAHLCDDSSFPDWEVDNASRGASALASTLSDGDYMALSRAAVDFSFSLPKFYGLYQHNASRNEWQKIEDSSDLRFRFWNGQAEYNLIISGSSDTWTQNITSDGQTIACEVPKTLHIDLIAGTTSNLTADNIMSVKIRSDFQEADHLSLSATIDAANIYVESDLTASNTKIDENVTLYVDNASTYVRTTAVSSKTSISGSRLCYAASWTPDENDELPAFGLISSATNTTKCMRRVQVKSSISDMASFAKYCDFYADRYDYADPRAEAEAAAAAMSRSVKAEMYYAGNTSKVRATLGWEACLYDQYYDEWGIRPTITFTSDDTPYSFEEYFGQGRFLSVENRFMELFRGYSQYFNGY